MTTLEKYKKLRLNIPDYYTLIVINKKQKEISLIIRSQGKPSKGQHNDIIKRFKNYQNTRKRIEYLRIKYKDKESGIIRIPSFTGGGGLGLLEAIRVTRKYGTYFEYMNGGYYSKFTVFHISTKPINFWIKRT